MFDPSWLLTIELIAEWSIRLIMLLVVPFRRIPDAAKSWLLLIFFLPIPGLILYLLIGRTVLPRSRREILSRLPAALQPTIDHLLRSPNLGPVHSLEEFDSIRRIAHRLTSLNALAGNQVEIVVDYRDTIRRLAEDIDAAKHHVHLVFYILREDEWTEPVLAALIRARHRGVICRVLYDSYGSWGLAGSAAQRLKAAGVEVEQALPVSIFRRKAARFDLRNHRKIAIIDGRAAWTGSLNLIAADFKKRVQYEELMVRVTGPVVLQLQYVFTSDWFQEREEILAGSEYFPDPVQTGPVSAQVLPSGPDFLGEGAHRLIVEMIHQARERVVITSPYFIPDQAVLVALTNAVLRGVKVTLIFSTRMDQTLVHLAQKSYYGELLRAGVHIYLYRPAFLHAKFLTIDNSLAMIGTSNMDIRSFQLNSEVSLLCYDTQVTAQLQAHQADYIANSDPLTREAWGDQQTFVTKFTQAMARLMGPLL